MSYLKSKFDGEEAKQIAEKFVVELNELPLQFGLFDDSYDEVGGIHEDKDYHLRMEIDGRWKTAVIHDGFAHHFSMMTRRGKNFKGKAGDDWELTREKVFRE